MPFVYKYIDNLVLAYGYRHATLDCTYAILDSCDPPCGHSMTPKIPKNTFGQIKWLLWVPITLKLKGVDLF
jgi:hypothetical protein